MRVVIDTNVYVEARFDKKKKGAARRIVQECASGLVKIVYTETIEEEVMRVLKGMHASDVFLAKVYHGFGRGERLSDITALDLCADPTDNKFIDCAVAGNVYYLITRDGALLALDGQRGINVRTPQELYQENSSLRPSEP